ncbi:MAG: FAD-dependent oxidoreductase, partial [Fimbriimonadaceae bacterium]|nr:FAD-dependent oxidoreductase [Alphaproteobacteria bacterium]
ELAQAHRRLGAEVTVIEMFEPLGKDDPEATAIVLDQVRRDGVSILSGVKVAGVSGRAGNIRVKVEGPDGDNEVRGSHLLIATGRAANIGSLELEKADIAFDRGGIKVNAGMKTSNSRVYAIGDVAHGLQFTHVANYHAGLVIRNALFRLPAREKRKIIPWVTYTDPELAHVGLDEEAARKRHRKISVLRWPYAENDRAQTERKTNGFIKVITGRKGKILGATIVGENAGEIIQLWALALSQGLKIKAMTEFVSPYPTLSEISKRAAVTYYAASVSNPWLQRVIRFLRFFG